MSRAVALLAAGRIRREDVSPGKLRRRWRTSRAWLDEYKRAGGAT